MSHSSTSAAIETYLAASQLGTLLYLREGDVLALNDVYEARGGPYVVRAYGFLKPGHTLSTREAETFKPRRYVR